MNDIEKQHHMCLHYITRHLRSHIHIQLCCLYLKIIMKSSTKHWVCKIDKFNLNLRNLNDSMISYYKVLKIHLLGNEWNLSSHLVLVTKILFEKMMRQITLKNIKFWIEKVWKKVYFLIPFKNFNGKDKNNKRRRIRILATRWLSPTNNNILFLISRRIEAMKLSLLTFFFSIASILVCLRKPATWGSLFVIGGK